jgi:hypothetical protein
MVRINVWLPSLKAMIVILNVKYFFRKPAKIWILDQKFLKPRILPFPKKTPNINVIAHIFFLTFLVNLLKKHRTPSHLCDNP